MMRNNDLAKIRDNILKRKQKKRQQRLSTPSKTPVYVQPVERWEDPDFPKKTSSERMPFHRRLLVKSFFAASLFFVSMLLLTTNNTWLEKPRQLVNQALTEEFPFATVHAWYQAKFGAPLAIQPEAETIQAPLALPVSGEISQTFEETGQGVLISPTEDTDVVAIESGTVLFAGNDRETGKTVIIQHPDRSKSIYGNLTNMDVHAYQSIQTNQKIGIYEPQHATDEMYFAIEKNHEYMDPIQVIHVDEQP
ncbi:M23 family metallopeptidase [Gracilibacillus alcaliphilus]|uniref:M23 family metallopeptidase n=1 Tax=Gracilibacillus alcaliphilus TaxID=1401441 RepID=UPI001EF8618C|nr:M23 family metallopeptidase [Gracilibacillus alcaliphilus]MBM7678561.1 stage IV sporulation protein FA [Gracilibacillus alcaliphilus]